MRGPHQTKPRLPGKPNGLIAYPATGTEHEHRLADIPAQQVGTETAFLGLQQLTHRHGQRGSQRHKIAGALRGQGTDRHAGKHTLAVVFGRPAIRYLYAALLLLAPFTTLPLLTQDLGGVMLVQPWLSLIAAFFLIRRNAVSKRSSILTSIFADFSLWMYSFFYRLINPYDRAEPCDDQSKYC